MSPSIPHSNRCLLVTSSYKTTIAPFSVLMIVSPSIQSTSRLRECDSERERKVLLERVLVSNRQKEWTEGCKGSKGLILKESYCPNAALASCTHTKAGC